MTQLTGSLEEEPKVRTSSNFFTENANEFTQNRPAPALVRPSSSTENVPINNLTEKSQNILQKKLNGVNTTNQKTIADMQHRQKIFEEEIIKRIKEIQRYAKNLHLQLKKIQNTSGKMRDEIDSDKDILIELQHTVESNYKKYTHDRLKQVSQAELDSKIKEQEFSFNDKIV